MGRVAQPLTSAREKGRVSASLPGRLFSFLADIILRDAKRVDPAWTARDDARIPIPAGRHRHISARNIPMIEQNLMISTVWDVTEAREVLSRSERSHRSLLDSVLKAFVYGRVEDEESGNAAELVMMAAGRSFERATGNPVGNGGQDPSSSPSSSSSSS
jgi:hypothetical protein